MQNPDPLYAIFPSIIADERRRALVALLSSQPVSSDVWGDALAIVMNRKVLFLNGVSRLDVELAVMRTLWDLLTPKLHSQLCVFTALVGAGVPTSLLEQRNKEAA